MSTTARIRPPLLCFLGLTLAVFCTAVGQQPQDADPQPLAAKLFEPPVRLMVGDIPLNVEAEQMYPSPAMFDIDDDGQIELIVGDIFGTLNVYENENPSGQGDPVWSSHVALESADGQPIKVHNW